MITGSATFTSVLAMKLLFDLCLHKLEWFFLGKKVCSSYACVCVLLSPSFRAVGGMNSSPALVCLCVHFLYN